MDSSWLPKFNRYLFIILILVFGVTFFTRNNIRNVDEIMPEVLKEPIQRMVYNQEEIKFVKDGCEYHLTPLYNYEINALIVSRMNYRLFSIYKYDSVFPVDLCLIWGSNVATKVYKNNSLNFSQDCRWCWAQWYGNINFNFEEISNNHLLVNNAELERKIKSLLRGDQVKIKGKLVNVKAKIIGKTGGSDINWNTSTLRTDSGAGACEVIYVEDIQVLKKTNVISRVLFRYSYYGLLLMILWNIINFFMPSHIKYE